VIGLFDREAIEAQHPVTHFALGLIAVTVGNHLQIRKLRNAFGRLGWLVLFESVITPALVFAAVGLGSSESWQLSALLAAMAISTAPATTIALVKEARAKGVFVKTLVAGVALNNLACICLFEVARYAGRVSFGAGGDPDWMDAVILPLKQLASAAALGGLAGYVLVRATRHVVRRDRLATSSMVAILLTSGLADYLDVSSLLSCMFLGMALANLTPDKDETGHGVFIDFEKAIYAVFFTLAGMELDFRAVVPGGMIAALVVCARILGKILSARGAMMLAGATQNLRNNLGLALIPQAGVAVGLIFLIQEDEVFDLHFRQLALAVGLTVVTVNEIIGPILTRWALNRSGDQGKDRARLIDFLQEENIITDLEAETKEEAIRKLADVLIQSNHLHDDRERLVQSILDREAQVSTCVGGGLAVPHGVLESGKEIAGAMGISRVGLPFETPDGRPVHCMVVLATPETQRKRHLEVLAALARAIGMDQNVQAELFNADSSAHAYEVLHAEESEEFNYFLED
jgi:mannitol/fructose-specific phosphotransferase system IIA component (Ntr-type)/Kef-type K+ transport system membrane component KefB